MTTSYFKHTIGSGLHYITDHLQSFPDGSVQFGDSSEVCILFTLEQVLSRNGIPHTVNDLWNMVYPEDYMADEDMAYIAYSAIEFTENFDPTNPVNIHHVLADLKSMGCGTLAELAESMLMEAGAI